MAFSDIDKVKLVVRKCSFEKPVCYKSFQTVVQIFFILLYTASTQACQTLLGLVPLFQVPQFPNFSRIIVTLELGLSLVSIVI